MKCENEILKKGKTIIHLLDKIKCPINSTHDLEILRGTVANSWEATSIKLMGSSNWWSLIKVTQDVNIIIIIYFRIYSDTVDCADFLNPNAFYRSRIEQHLKAMIF